jgi:hypothetical protein
LRGLGYAICHAFIIVACLFRSAARVRLELQLTTTVT